MALVKIVNAEGGSDARYRSDSPDTDHLIDSNGLPVGSESWLYPDMNSWTAGLPGARGGSGPGFFEGGGGGGGGGGDLTASPYYQQYQSQIQAAQAADLSNVKSQLQQLLIQFGLVPEGFSDKYGALDDTIRGLIQKNTDTGVSQYSRLLEARDNARRSSLQNLARQGMSRSGSKGYALRQGSLNFDRSLSDALSGVLGTANQLQTGYAGREIERQSGLSNLLAQLAQSFTPRAAGSAGRTFAPAPPRLPTPQPMPVYESQAGPSPYQPVQNGTYTGGALFATPTENKDINPIFYFK